MRFRSIGRVGQPRGGNRHPKTGNVVRTLYNSTQVRLPHPGSCGIGSLSAQDKFNFLSVLRHILLLTFKCYSALFTMEGCACGLATDWDRLLDPDSSTPCSLGNKPGVLESWVSALPLCDSPHFWALLFQSGLISWGTEPPRS